MTTAISVAPVGFVAAARSNPEDDFWGGESARITPMPLPVSKPSLMSRFSSSSIR